MPNKEFCSTAWSFVLPEYARKGPILRDFVATNGGYKTSLLPYKAYVVLVYLSFLAILVRPPLF